MVLGLNNEGVRIETKIQPGEFVIEMLKILGIEEQLIIFSDSGNNQIVWGQSVPTHGVPPSTDGLY